MGVTRKPPASPMGPATLNTYSTHTEKQVRIMFSEGRKMSGTRQKKELLISRVSNNFTNIFPGIIYSIFQVNNSFF